MEVSTLSDNSLVELAVNGNSDAFSEIVNRHSKIVSMEIFRHTPSGFIQNDLRQNQQSIIWDAVIRYKPERGKLVTWLGNYSYYACKTLISQERGNKLIGYAPDELETISDFYVEQQYLDNGRREMEKRECLEIIEDILSQIKDEGMKAVVRERYFSGKIKTYKEVGAKLGISHEWVRQTFKKFIELAKNRLTSKDCLDVV